MDLRNTSLVVTILSLTVSAVVIWSSFLGHGESDEISRSEREMRSLLSAERLSQQTKVKEPNTQGKLATPQFIVSHFPWLVKNNTLGNYFTHGFYKRQGKYHSKFSHGSMVLLPFYQDFDGHFERCLKTTGLRQNQAVSPRMSLSNRFKWDTSQEGPLKFKHKFKIHYGEAAFGVCDGSHHGGIERADSQGDINKCNYALILQDPIALAMTEFAACRANPHKSQCGKFPHAGQRTKSNFNSIEEWILRRGSPVFQSFLFQSHICQQNDDILSKPNGTNSQANISDKDSNFLQYQCEKNLAVFLQNLEPNVIRQLLEFIVSHIPRWFSLVGIYEDLASSLSMLHQVFRVGFHKCEFVDQLGKLPWSSKQFQAQTDLQKPSKEKILTRKPNFIADSLKILPMATQSQNKIPLPKGSTLNKIPVKETVSPSEDTFTTINSRFPSSVPAERENGLVGVERSEHHNINVTTSNTLLTLSKDQNQESFSKDITTQPDSVTGNFLLNMFNISSPETETPTDRPLDYLNALTSNREEREGNNDIYKVVDHNLLDNNVLDNNILDANFLDITGQNFRGDEYILKFNKKQTNRAWNTLYNRLANSPLVKRALSLDIEIYRAVKKLYKTQKKIFLSSPTLM